MTLPAATNAVVGVTGFFRGKSLKSWVCSALCAIPRWTRLECARGFPGQHRPRLDGWANRDLDIGAIIALAPNITALD